MTTAWGFMKRRNRSRKRKPMQLTFTQRCEVSLTTLAKNLRRQISISRYILIFRFRVISRAYQLCVVRFFFRKKMSE
jgi:hypothetical protein